MESFDSEEECSRWVFFFLLLSFSNVSVFVRTGAESSWAQVIRQEPRTIFVGEKRPISCAARGSGKFSVSLFAPPRILVAKTVSRGLSVDSAPEVVTASGVVDFSRKRDFLQRVCDYTKGNEHCRDLYFICEVKDLVRQKVVNKSLTPFINLKGMDGM